MRFFLIVFLWVAFTALSFPVFSQESFDGSGSIVPSLEEYKDIPPGVLMPKDYVAPQLTPAEGAEEEEGMTIEDILAAYHAGKHDLVMQRIMPLAKDGRPAAMELLGLMYRNGEGTPKNSEQAILWLTKAAEAERPLAQHHLGVITYAGEGVIADPVKALMWLHLAILHYPEGPEKTRAMQDRDAILGQLTRRDKDRAQEMAREWLTRKDEAKNKAKP